MDDPPKKFFRLGPEREVRLRYGFVIKCTDVIRDEDGEVVELRCEFDPSTRGGNQPQGRKVKGIIHWVSADHCAEAEVRLYDRLFSEANPLADKERAFTEAVNPDSLEVLTDCKVEASLAKPLADTRYQFERTGYFYADKDSSEDKLIFNRIVTLRDTWAKLSG